MNYIEYTFMLENITSIFVILTCAFQMIVALLRKKKDSKINWNSVKLLNFRLVLLGIQIIAIILLLIPKINTMELHEIYTNYSGNILDLKNNKITSKNESFLDGVKETYGSDFNYLKEDTYYFDDLQYEGELLDINFGTYLKNVMAFNSNEIVKFNGVNINKHTERLTLKSDKTEGENIELSGNTIDGKFYIFADQPLANDGQLNKYLSVFIKEIDLIYDTYSPPMDGQNIMSNYKILEIKTTEPLANVATESQLK